MRKPRENMDFFKQRRKNLSQIIGENSALILTANPEYIRNNDVHYSYRQDSNFYYLTGFEEPESILVFRPGQKQESILFVREKNVERETWDGFRFGTQGAKAEFHMDEVYDISKFSEIVPSLLLDINKLYYRFFHFKDYDDLVRKSLLDLKDLRRRSGTGNLPIEDSYQIIGEMRIKKSNHEIDHMRKAAEINAYAHSEVMRAIHPGINERALHGIFIKSIMEKGAEREAYGGIFASGNNATTLHYVFNDQICQDGDLFLIDAGPEFNFYASDVTRTYPVNGKMTVVQNRVYTRILDIQKNVIAKVKPGVTMQELQNEAISDLVDLMLSEGLLRGNKQEIISNQEYRKYYPHGIGHWLGMDVHDAGLTTLGGEPRRLEPGMAITIEPGLYVPAGDDSAPKDLRGIGIRIEDNLIITDSGSENLTSSIPK